MNDTIEKCPFPERMALAGAEPEGGYAEALLREGWVLSEGGYAYLASICGAAAEQDVVAATAFYSEVGLPTMSFDSVGKSMLQGEYQACIDRAVPEFALAYGDSFHQGTKLYVMAPKFFGSGLLQRYVPILHRVEDEYHFYLESMVPDKRIEVRTLFLVRKVPYVSESPVERHLPESA